MRVRKIPKNYIFVTGRFSGKKGGGIADFESTFEKNYVLVLEFDETVDRFETQPVRVPVVGVAKGYVPDVLVHFGQNTRDLPSRKPQLVDVKHSDELKRNEAKYAPKFAATTQFADEHG